MNRQTSVVRPVTKIAYIGFTTRTAGRSWLCTAAAAAAATQPTLWENVVDLFRFLPTDSCRPSGCSSVLSGSQGSLIVRMCHLVRGRKCFVIDIAKTKAQHSLKSKLSMKQPGMMFFIPTDYWTLVLVQSVESARCAPGVQLAVRARVQDQQHDERMHENLTLHYTVHTFLHYKCKCIHPDAVVHCIHSLC